MQCVDAVLEILSGAEVKYIFGNPGSTELPLINSLAADLRFQYIFGLHELPITAMAEGYAMALGSLCVASVHTCCGLGNAMGMLYNARCAGTPLLMIAGQQDSRMRFEGPALSGDMVSVASPWSKWAVEVHTPKEAVSAVRRAIEIALTPPCGPVFVALPIDVQQGVMEDLDLRPPFIPEFRTRPSEASLQTAADLLLHAQHPAILAGSRVAESE